jgi:iron complex transport system permease protein
MCAVRAASAYADLAGSLSRARRRRSTRRATAVGGLALLVLGLFALSLMLGHTFYGPGDVLRVVAGQDVPGASFTVGQLRLPRACLGLLAGACLGAGGVTFQTMLRNPLASPDVIGIQQGASAAAVFSLVFLSVGQTGVSVIAIAAALATALGIYVLSFNDGIVGARLVLIGIGVAAMLHSVVTYVLARADQWDLQMAMRWLTGSLGSADWDVVRPLGIGAVVVAPLLLAQSRRLDLLLLGDDAASALGVPVERTRLLAILAAVGLLAFATAAAGPIAFVAFLSGPIAVRLVGPGISLVVPSALVGSALVLGADLVGQWAFGTRYPVGVVTGALGAPFLVYLLIRAQRTGGSL